MTEEPIRTPERSTLFDNVPQETLLQERQKLNDAMRSTPEGWRLVPVEPTREMIDAAEKNDREHPHAILGGAPVRSLYKAMLAAAPAQGGRDE